MPAKADPTTVTAPTLSAGLAWILNLGPFGWDNALLISKLLWWLWVADITFGASMTIAYRNSARPVDWLLCLYFTAFSIMGLLWHSRELYLRLRLHGKEKGAPVVFVLRKSTFSSAWRSAVGYMLLHPMTWMLNLSWLGWEGIRWLTKAGWWVAVWLTIYFARVAIVCSNPPWSAAADCQKGYGLSALLFTVAWITLLLAHSREAELERLMAEGKDHARDEGMPRQSTATTTPAEYSTLGWVLNFGMFGWAGATALTKIILWIQIIYLITAAAISYAFRDLPGDQWYWTWHAVLYVIMGLNVFVADLAVKCARGDSV